MVKKQVGVKKDYTKQFLQMQKDLAGVDRDFKLAIYKDFFKSIAKAADRRLVNLERLSNKEGYENILSWAYKDAMREIRGIYGQDARRFNRVQPDDLRKVHKKCVVL